MFFLETKTRSESFHSLAEAVQAWRDSRAIERPTVRVGDERRKLSTSELAAAQSLLLPRIK